MGVIFMPKHLIWKIWQCALIIILIMHCHTRNLYCGALSNFHVLILLTKKRIKNMKKQHPQLGFTFITSLEVVLLMVEFRCKTKKCVICVNKNLQQINLQKYTPEKNSLWWRQQFLIFIPVYKYQPSKSWSFAYHMCAYLVQITVVKCDAQPSNNMNYFNIFYVVVIILRG